MKTKTGITCSTAIAVIFAVLLLTGRAVSAGPVKVTDSNGTNLFFSAPPQRVVSLVPSATEMLFEINAGNAVLGLTYHDATLKGAEEKNLIGGFFQPSIEKIKSLEPDLVILAGFHENIQTELETSGFKVFVHDTRSVQHSIETVKTFGCIFNRKDQARKVIEKNRKELALIQKKLAKAVPGKPKRVIRLMGRGKIMTPGSNSFQNELISLAGGIPPDFGKTGPVVEVTKEEWIKFNPEVIYGCGGDKNTAESFFSRPGWKDVDAVKNGRVFYFPCELTCRAATHYGYFVQWISSIIYTDEFAQAENEILPTAIQHSRPLKVDLDYVKSAAINTAAIYDFDNKTLMIDFKRPQAIVSTLEGRRDNILSVGNHYSPPPTWGPGHKLGIDHIKAQILKANKKREAVTSFLITGADMDNLSIREAEFKDMKAVALVTAGVISNAGRTSKDTGLFYEPGTINIIIMTNMKLSGRAMTRAIITATEAKTAALEDMDIRSSATPLMHEATGTGTDNILVVQGEGVHIENCGGHTKMGELIAKAVYAGVNEAVLKQNKISAKRHIFQRLKERHIPLFSLVSDIDCGCPDIESFPSEALSRKVEHLLLEKKYSAFIETAFAVSDGYEKGLIKDLTLYNNWCTDIAADVSGKEFKSIPDYLQGKKIPLVLKTALNTIIAGALAAQEDTRNPINHK